MPITLGKNIYYSPGEVGEIMGLHVITIRNLMRTGKLPGAKLGGRWYILEENLIKALSGNTNKSEPKTDGEE